MTREERAREVLISITGSKYLQFEDDPCADRYADRVSAPNAIAAMLAFADAEAAAMRERAAEVCDDRGVEEHKGFGLTRAAQNYFRARDAIRALSATREE